MLLPAAGSFTVPVFAEEDEVLPVLFALDALPALEVAAFVAASFFVPVAALEADFLLLPELLVAEDFVADDVAPAEPVFVPAEAEPDPDLPDELLLPLLSGDAVFLAPEAVADLVLVFFSDGVTFSTISSAFSVTAVIAFLVALRASSPAASAIASATSVLFFFVAILD